MRVIPLTSRVTRPEMGILRIFRVFRGLCCRQNPTKTISETQPITHGVVRERVVAELLPENFRELSAELPDTFLTQYMNVCKSSAEFPQKPFPNYPIPWPSNPCFFRFPYFFRFPISLACLCVFPFFSKDFRGSAKRKTLAFFGVSGLEGQGKWPFLRDFWRFIGPGWQLGLQA